MGFIGRNGAGNFNYAEGSSGLVQLNNGEKIPVVGFGTWQTLDGEVAEKSVIAAIDAGYRHIDTAAIYKNEGVCWR